MAKRKSSPATVDWLAVIGDHLPRRCGIATFTSDLCDALEGEMPDEGHVEVVAMDDVPEGYKYPERVKFQVRDNVQADYLRAAEFVNVNHFDMAVMQHEYGIYGGASGSHILSLIKSLRMPVVSTLHTVLTEPSDEQRAIMVDLARYCERLVVMSDLARDILHDVYEIDKSKTAFIPHGIPDLPFSDTQFFKDQFNLLDNMVILTFGLLSPGKGIEHMIDAMPQVVDKHPEAVYIVLGATHPHVLREMGDAYRSGLQQRVNKLGMQDHVIFRNQFVESDTLCKYLCAADIYVTPYLDEAQITSGTLAYAMGSGTAVVSTPYWYANEMLADGRGRLTPFRDSEAMAAEINALLDDDTERLKVRRKAYEYTRAMVWKEVARSYFALADEVKHQLAGRPHPVKITTPASPIVEQLPEIDVRHLETLTDDTGVLHHAIFATPDRSSGYAVTDNARALAAICRHHKMMRETSYMPLIQVYLSFLNHAFNGEEKRFRDVMTYDRRWKHEVGSEEAHAEALLSLGWTVRHAPSTFLRDVASRLLGEAYPSAEDFQSPAAWAFTLVGLHEYLAMYGGDSDARRLRNVLAERLQKRFEDNSDPDWPWFDGQVTATAAKMPHALLLAGQWIPNSEMFESGIKSLGWLLDQQTAPGGHLSLIGDTEWLVRNGERSRFDQRPCAAMHLAEACAEAFRATADQQWLEGTRRCIEWFLGRNDLNAPVYDFRTAGCGDSLQMHGSNENQGAEATLAWLVTLMTMSELLGEQVLVEQTADRRRAASDEAEPAEEGAAEQEQSATSASTDAD